MRPMPGFVALALASLAASMLMAEPEKKGGPPLRRPEDIETAPFPRALLLNGRAFPQVASFAPRLPEPKRTFYVALSGPPGDGSRSRPWTDLQVAFRQLVPGDRLQILHGEYRGSFSIDDTCRNGTAEAPIEVFFEASGLEPEAAQPALSVKRAFWYFERLHASLADHEGPGLEVSSHDVLFDNAFIQKGRGPGIRVAPGASRVTIAHANILKIGVTQPGPDSVGVEIAPRTREVQIVASRLYQNPAGSIRVDAARDDADASDIALEDNSIRDDGGPGIALLGGERVKIARNTIFYGRRTKTPSRAIVVEAAHGVTIENNRISDAAEAIRIGFADVNGGPFLRSQDVTIARNALDSAIPKGIAIAVEAGRKVRITNNVIEGYDDAILILSAPPQTEAVSVANNLVLSVSDVAFVLADAKAAAFFDYNVFSPKGESVDAQAGKETLDLTKFLTQGKMPHTKAVKGVALRNRDLSAIDGVATVDQGKAFKGISFKGVAPDIGVAEK